MTQAKRKWLAPFLGVALTAAVGVAGAQERTGIPAASTPRPVVLQQKWVAGQQLQYDVLLDGAAQVQIPADARAAGLLAGVPSPLEIDCRMQGRATLETLAVNDFGQGKVTLRVGELNLQGQAFGQNGALQLTRGRGFFSINGQNIGNEINWPLLDRPTTALLISRRGHLEGFEKIAPAQPAVQPMKAEKPSGTKLDYPALIRATLLRALPTLWPAGAVRAGDSWVEEIGTASLSGTGRAAPGRLQFTAQGEEEIGGRKTWRIAVEGEVAFDREDAQQAVGQLPEKERAQAEAKLKWFGNARQYISGDLWFDPVLGQVVRAKMSLDGQAQGRAQHGQNADGRSSFTGLVQMQLKNVSYADRAPEAATN